MFDLQEPNYVRTVSDALSLQATRVSAAIRLLDEGNTIPFIARYRKEMTGELDENQLRDIAAQYESQRNLHQRKSDVLRLLDEQGVFEDHALREKLVAATVAAKTLTEVEDVYRPYRPKRKTRASVAKEKGLAPLAAWLQDAAHLFLTEEEVVRQASQFVSAEKGVLTTTDAVDGASDIIAEEVADDAESRKWVRSHTLLHGAIRSTAVDAEADSVYEVYYDYQEPLAKTLPHRILAMNRGEREGVLRISLVHPQDDVLAHLLTRHVAGKRGTGTGAATPGGTPSAVGDILHRAVTDGYKRLILPAIEREIRAQLTERAEAQAINIFGENLKNLLMQPPIRGKTVLGVDPAFRTGCKLAVVDDTGKLLVTAVIYPTPPQNKVEQARQEVFRLVTQHNIDLIVIGNGTASRETEAFIADCVRLYQEAQHRTVPYVIVSEAGASVYSASQLAGQEFPNLDVSERSAISIARRMQDPLAELVKIDPKSVGVGQYQHDVSQKKLDEKLTAVVESAVNQVGVDVNTASPSLLSYVAGLSKTVATNIVAYREQNGRFQNRKALAKVPRFGPKTLEQSVGFLRIQGGDELLDATPIHPESYSAVIKLLGRVGDPHAFFTSAQTRSEWLQSLKSVPVHALSEDTDIGVPTLRDILDALERPGRDPREDVPAPLLRTDVLKLEDLEIGMVLTGTVRNVVDFGAFVDIGIKNDGLVHISQLSDRFVKHPMEAVSVGDIVQVRVLQLDPNKGRVGLSMKGLQQGSV